MSFNNLIKEAIQAQDLITNLIGEKPVELSPLDGGTVSAVYFVKLQDKSNQVLKFSDNPIQLLHEKHFLESWSKTGIRTPEVYQYKVLDEILDPDRFHDVELQGAVLYMEYVRGQNLFSLLEIDAVKPVPILHDLGAILARLHQVTTRGYGRILSTPNTSNGKLEGEKKVYSETLETPQWLEILQANYDFGEFQSHDVWLVEKAAKLLDEQRSGLGGCYVHNDFRAGNILYDSSSSHPYTVIDPKAVITHPYLCLAYSLVLEEIHGRYDPKPWLVGYEEVSRIDDVALKAAMFLKALELLPRWGQQGQPYAKALLKLFREKKAWLQTI